MRELQDDLKWQNATPIAKEWLDRAIAAEGAVAILTETVDIQRASIQELSRRQVELTDENANLTAQVAGLREGLEKISNLRPININQITQNPDMSPMDKMILTCPGNMDVGTTAQRIANELLSFPDPGEKYRERMATLEDIARAADLLECETCESCHCQPLLDIRKGIAALEGGRE